MARACPYEKSNRGEEAQGKPDVTRRVTTEKQSVNEKNGKTPKKSRILECAGNCTEQNLRTLLKKSAAF